MFVERLRLTDFRNYRELDLVLPRGLVVLQGRNAQGKSNILEAIGLVATSRSFRTSSEREAVRWGAPGRFARVDASIRRRVDLLDVEVVVADAGTSGSGATGSAAASAAPPGTPFRKRIRINGVPHRAMDLLGQVTVVIFAPTDLDLVIGSPAERRRFLDLTLCQVHPPYCRALSQYQKVIAQRAALLRRIRENEEGPHALSYWDDQLARLAAPIILTRAGFLGRAEASAAQVYANLTAGAPREGLGSLEPNGDAAETDLPEARELEVRGLQLAYRPSYAGPLAGGEAEVAEGIKVRLLELRPREIAQGVNVLGPHRDDIAFLAGDVDLAVYGSRGQQRTVALALKLAELEYIEMETGEQPILLLDDVLSELDAERRRDLLAAVRDLDQVLLTVTDVASVPDEARAGARLYAVRGGQVRELPGA
jgi:DNA replication and repair protein RecF